MATTATTATLKQGDRVIITARDQTSADVKSQLYFPHFGNLAGRILKVYGEEASVLVDRETLPAEVRARHEEGETAERQKYLDRLSETARSGLSDKEKNFKLNYAVLVSLKDLRPDDGKAAPAPAVPTSAQRADAKAVAQSMKAVDPVTGASTVGEANLSADTDVPRKTEADLTAAEEEFLRQRAGGDSKKKR